MPVPQHITDRFGGPDRVPAYIVRHYERRERLQAERIEREKERRRKLDAERARVKALRRPPRNARLVRVGTYGCKIAWDHTETYAKLKPAGYWISENRNGSGWTTHGDYLKPDKLEGWLYSRWGEKVEASVEAYYSDTALGEVYRSEIVRCEPEPAPETRAAPEPSKYDQSVIETVRGYLAEPRSRRPPIYYSRWTRALAALGAAEHPNPMTHAEAQRYADLGWRRWIPVARAIRRRNDRIGSHR